MQSFTQVVDFVAQVIDGAGVAVIVLGLSVAAIRAATTRIPQATDLVALLRFV